MLASLNIEKGHHDVDNLGALRPSGPRLENNLNISDTCNYFAAFFACSRQVSLVKGDKRFKFRPGGYPLVLFLAKPQTNLLSLFAKCLAPPRSCPACSRPPGGLHDGVIDSPFSVVGVNVSVDRAKRPTSENTSVSASGENQGHRRKGALKYFVMCFFSCQMCIVPRHGLRLSGTHFPLERVEAFCLLGTFCFRALSNELAFSSVG